MIELYLRVFSAELLRPLGTQSHLGVIFKMARLRQVLYALQTLLHCCSVVHTTVRTVLHTILQYCSVHCITHTTVNTVLHTIQYCSAYSTVQCAVIYVVHTVQCRLFGI